MLRLLSFFAIYLMLSFPIQAQHNADDILGTWFNEEKDAKIEIYKENDAYQGKIVWVDQEPGETKLDENNPDPSLRSRPVVGLKILRDFTYEDGEYEDGEIYDPKSGNTYDCYMRLESRDKLFLRGYVGFSLLGRTTYWSRVN